MYIRGEDEDEDKDEDEDRDQTDVVYCASPKQATCFRLKVYK
jgi:hypothetical protein